ncbi:hypothetical protein DH2020_039005 [Rehmannia glutinosa]|uniref:NB-ARC domain-containing protein n=1 Tax=Rehmannia glutinosa TaxID=99300 RepID=A0ABR0UYL4_REHGL
MGSLSVPLLMADSFEEFEFRSSAEDIILAALGDENISIIGICGFPGKGSKLATRIVEKSKKEKLFSVVLTVEGSFLELHTEDRILIVLDDVPEMFDLENFEILLLKHKGLCKIIMTSQFKSVFSGMGATKIFAAKEELEVWILLREKSDSCDFYPLAKSVANKFRGLAKFVANKFRGHKFRGLLDLSVVDRILKDKSKIWPRKLLKPALTYEFMEEEVMKGSIHLHPELSSQVIGGSGGTHFQYDMNEKGFCLNSNRSTITEKVNANEVQKVDCHGAKMEVSIDIALLSKNCLAECILFCSILPLEYRFTKDVLIWQWIAQGLIKLDEDEIMEEAGSQSFDALLNLDYIVVVVYGYTFDQAKYKVGDKMIVFLQDQLLEPKFQKNLDSKEIDVAKVEHLSLASKEVDHINFDILKRCSRLQTLIIHRCFGSIELRYLDISETPLMRLSKCICCLSNLQTLKLDGCSKIYELPDCTSELINLRHLILDVARMLDSMPKGIGKLTKLRTLKAFLVGDCDGYRIGELKYLNKLKGSLSIRKLENVMNKEEATEACLCNKHDLKKIELYWSVFWDEKNPNEEEILESLQPPFGIQELKIFFYRGGVLPSWISSPLFSELVSIVLYRCKYYDSLPSLGDLPSLKLLEIVENNVVMKIDSLFCRKQSNQHHVAFPKLEKLSFESMSKLEKWTGLKNGDFPSLNSLSIMYCPKFVGLPLLLHLKSLSYMVISSCPKLSCLPKGGLPPMLETLRISDCPMLNERCYNKDWSKVAHVRNFCID